MTEQGASGVSVSSQGDVTIGGDVVGRDKIVYNIALVGQFLHHAEVEGWLNLSSSSSEIQATEAVLQAYLSGVDVGVDAIRKAAGVGEILAPALAVWRPDHAQSALPFRATLVRMAQPLFDRLAELQYWDAYAEALGSDDWVSVSAFRPVDVLWLHSLSALWRHVENEEKLYGLATRWFGEERVAFFVVRTPASRAREVYDPSGPTRPGTDLMAMGRRQFRVFIVGLMADVARLAADAASDRAFWQRLPTIADKPGGEP